MTDKVTIYEVGLRDGIQSIPHKIDSDDKLALLDSLCKLGLTHLEVASFVHPKKVPNMADSEYIYSIAKDKAPVVSGLVMNQRGFQRSQVVGMDKVNIVFSPDEVFNRNNLGMTMRECIYQYGEMLSGFDRKDIRVYISMAFDVPLNDLLIAFKIASAMGDTVVLSDTNGKAVPASIEEVISMVTPYSKNLALHLHYCDNLMSNVSVGYRMGVREFDSSIGGLGGCPFVLDSGSNLATEDLIKWCHDHKIDCGIDYTANRKHLARSVMLANRMKKPRIRVILRNKLLKIKEALGYV